ncbi:DUF6438 domain-containing protein [Evansella tamaricis]|uniref:DUF6438 domain-containing protein n=1 Tax=Evansella tamaricis TaxID=2069301 RepID=A0ABS6JIS5_9BACI|nr:DUF6438 domain-containing protein [Evansella tamaricis]MBU9713581.1 hypothetical protein [Evansella tamaricis]
MIKKITFERTACYGSCPIYKVEVFSDGEVKWNGFEYVSKLGIHEWKLTAKKMEKLNGLIEEFDFRNYEYKTSDIYATDHPSCLISIEFEDGYVKHIDHYLGDQLEDEWLVDLDGPVRMTLEQFERRLEGIIGTGKYVKEPLYIFHIRNKVDPILAGCYKGHVVVSNNEKDALSMIPLGVESILENGDIELKEGNWMVRKLGKDATETLYPYVVLSEKV